MRAGTFGHIVYPGGYNANYLNNRVSPPAPVDITVPTAYWKLDEASGTASWVDQITSPAACNLAKFGTVNSGIGIINGASSLASNNGGGLQNISGLPAKMLPGSGSWSFAAWFKRASLGASLEQIALYSGAFNEQNGWTLYVTTSTGAINLRICQSAKFSQLLTHSTTVVVGIWHFIVAQFDSVASKIRLSLDGNAFQEITASACAAATIFSLNNGNNVGALGVRGLGLVDESAWWKGTVVSLAEAAALYNSGAGKTYSVALGWV